MVNNKIKFIIKFILKFYYTTFVLKINSHNIHYEFVKLQYFMFHNLIIIFISKKENVNIVVNNIFIILIIIFFASHKNPLLFLKYALENTQKGSFPFESQLYQSS